MRTLVVGSAIALSLLTSPRAPAEFTLEDDGKSLTVLEDGKPVLGYNYGRIDPPEDSKADPERYWRSSYVHPLYGLDGEVLTQDFPDDHYHHRGVYWTWPRCRVGDRPMDLWTIVGARQLFEEWMARSVGEGKAEIGVRNTWRFDDDPEPKVREEVHIVVHPASEHGRALDFHLAFTNICSEPVAIQGQTTQDKGYGGFCFRPDARLRPLVFTTAQGPQKQDALTVATPWADVSFGGSIKAPKFGVAMFQHPSNPDYPHDGWILRHYGFLGASWPHTHIHLLEPGASLELRYRLYVHRGDAEAAKVAQVFQAYVQRGR